jgi:hypothetical protein
MTSYVVVSGTSSSKKPGQIYFAKRDVVYNLRLAARRRDKATYVRMLKLKSHINYAIRMQDQLGDPTISIRLETWKSGQKYVVRGVNGKFRAVIDK